MQLILANCAVVMVTDGPPLHVNHDFLVSRQIIPADFQKIGSINTPVVSQIDYKNGFRLTTESNRIIFRSLKQDHNIEDDNEQNNKNRIQLLKTIISQYIKEFAYLCYKQMGINFYFIKPNLQYDSFIDKILKTNSSYLDFENNKAAVQNINLSYSVKGRQFNIAVSRQSQETDSSSPGQSRFVSLFHINVHYPNKYADNKALIAEEIEENYMKLKNFLEKLT